MRALSVAIMVAGVVWACVIVCANATEVALVDRVHLRFVSKLAGVPPVIELASTSA